MAGSHEANKRTVSPHWQSGNVAYIFLQAKNGAAREKLAPASFVKVLIMLSKKTDKAIFNYGLADWSLITGWGLFIGSSTNLWGSFTELFDANSSSCTCRSA